MVVVCGCGGGGVRADSSPTLAITANKKFLVHPRKWNIFETDLWTHFLVIYTPNRARIRCPIKNERGVKGVCYVCGGVAWPRYCPGILENDKRTTFCPHRIKSLLYSAIKIIIKKKENKQLSTRNGRRWKVNNRKPSVEEQKIYRIYQLVRLDSTEIPILFLFFSSNTFFSSLESGG